ncbi:MAG TPA: DUF2683 family protein [Daejeonella sp.]|nr:DUF2683 family protein [Daejeonella sp.]
MAIVEVTSRQFRENQKSFFELADKGEKVVIKRGKKQAYVLTPIASEDLSFSPEMIERIKKSIQDIKEGKGITINTEEELDQYFENL